MSSLMILLLSLAANMDTFAIGVAYGTNAIKIGIVTNGFMALVSGFSTLLSLLVGSKISHVLSPIAAHHWGSFALILVGVCGAWATMRRSRKQHKRSTTRRQNLQNSIILVADRSTPEALKNHESDDFLQELAYETFLEHPEKADRDRSGYLDVQEAVTLAFGLSVNNLAIGIGSGLLSFPVAVTTGLMVLLSFVGVATGYYLGGRFKVNLSALWVGLVSSGLTILVGLCEYFAL